MGFPGALDSSLKPCCARFASTWAEVSPVDVSVPWWAAVSLALFAQAGKVCAPIMGICVAHSGPASPTGSPFPASTRRIGRVAVCGPRTAVRLGPSWTAARGRRGCVSLVWPPLLPARARPAAATSGTRRQSERWGRREPHGDPLPASARKGQGRLRL